MKIYGIGTDIIRVSRIKNSLKKKSIKIRLFNKKEIVKCQKTKINYNCYAKRFAAKEAFSKASGLGISKGLKFNEIEIVNNRLGKPMFNLIGETKIILQKKLNFKKISTYLSLSDEKKVAVAIVILSKK